MKAYLGLDLGTYMGWARTDLFPGSGGVFLSGAWDFDITRFDAPPVRYQKFEVKLRERVIPKSPVVRLGDVAEIVSADRQQVRQLAAVCRALFRPSTRACA